MNIDNAITDLCAFIDKSPTAYHVARSVGNRLAHCGFIPLDEKDKWKLKPNESYFVERGGGVCAFRLPSHTPTRAFIMAAHTDSPALKLKPHPEHLSHHMSLFRTEPYGSPLLDTWFDRDLALAGRVMTEEGESLLFAEESLIKHDNAH